MAPDFDLARLTQIREVMGVELSELVGGMLETMRVAIEQAEQDRETAEEAVVRVRRSGRARATNSPDLRQMSKRIRH